MAVLKQIDKILLLFGLIRKQKAEDDMRNEIDMVIRGRGVYAPGVELASFVRISRRYGFRVVYFLKETESAPENVERCIAELFSGAKPTVSTGSVRDALLSNTKHFVNNELGR